MEAQSALTPCSCLLKSLQVEWIILHPVLSGVRLEGFLINFPNVFLKDTSFDSSFATSLLHHFTNQDEGRAASVLRDGANDSMIHLLPDDRRTNDHSILQNTIIKLYAHFNLVYSPCGQEQQRITPTYTVL